MKDGLYIVDYKQICAAFVVEHGKITTCAPILRKNISMWQKKAKWFPINKNPLDEMPGQVVKVFPDEVKGGSSTPGLNVSEK